MALCLPLVVEEWDVIVLEADLQGTSISFLVDTGASASVVSLDVVRQLGLVSRMEPLEDPLPDYVAAFQDVICGCLPISILCKNFLELKPYFLVLRSGPLVLGMDVLKGYDCILDLDPRYPVLTLRRCHPKRLKMHKGLECTCLLNGREIVALVDSGSTYNVITEAAGKVLGLPVEEAQMGKLYTFLGNITVHGIARNVEIVVQGNPVVSDFMVMDNSFYDVIIGMKILSGFTIDFLPFK